MTKLFALSLVALAFAGPAGAAAGGCHAVSGTFTANQVFDGCAIFCTQGTLTGDLAGSYSFVANGITLTGPGTAVATGNSTITLTDGAVLTSNDHSNLDFGAGTFTTFIDFAGGTRQFAHATGGLVAPGVFTPTPGTAGTYSGEYCLANR